jgi:hypothetical protein
MSAAGEGGAPRSESVIIMIASGNHSMILLTDPNLNFSLWQKSKLSPSLAPLSDINLTINVRFLPFLKYFLWN